MIVGFYAEAVGWTVLVEQTFKLVAASQPHSRLGRTGYPVDVAGRNVGAVCLHRHLKTGFVKLVDERSVGLERWLAPGENHQTGAPTAYLGYDFLIAHEAERVEVGVAKRTSQVAASESHERSGTSGVASLALNGVENVVYPFHRSVLFVYRDVALALLNDSLVALGYL